ncbi:globin domain-containing protein [Flexithrix dorotheae]|uniref:globin domain-containing protein n=1 Tax=Flexithrix dorotheae TaxID=70993 RepID=UPI00037EC7DA|nr:globin domain-containing protein [Flexithrix dorotheae]
MTEAEILLVQKSWTAIQTRSDIIGVKFYTKLFEVQPLFKPLFHNERDEQAKKLMKLIGFAVTKIKPEIEEDKTVAAVGKRHIAYGVKEQDFEIFGKVLVETIGEELGEHWNPELEVAWGKAYQYLSKLMIRARH